MAGGWPRPKPPPPALSERPRLKPPSSIGGGKWLSDRGEPSYELGYADPE